MSRWLGLLVLTASGLWAGEQHPGLLLTAQEIPLVQQRLLRGPYSQWWTALVGRLEQPVPADDRGKMRRAKDLAFAYTLTDNLPWAQEAATLLSGSRFPPQGGDLGEPHIEGEAAALFAEALDMLHPVLERDDPHLLAQIRAVLFAEGQRLYAGLPVDLGFLTIPLDQTPHLNNWHLRAYAGLGLAALVLADSAETKLWAARAQEVVEQTFVWQVDSAEGGWGEGPFYLRYAAEVYLPYMLALRRDGADLLANPLVRRAHRWSLNVRLPNGQRPNIDDAHVEGFFGHYLSGVDEDGGLYRWDWENHRPGLFVPSFTEADAIVFFDDEVAASAPDGPSTLFMPTAGDAVLRSDWSAGATYFLLRGENGPARSRGLSHEHPDETSFVLFAGGQMLALDAGYINFDNHHKVNGAANHNLVLVDGEGPPLETLFGEVIGGGNDAFIENTFLFGTTAYAEVSAAYAGVETRRRVLFVDGQHFWIADRLVADRPRQYQWLLHGHGGGTSGGSYQRSGALARWGQPGVELLAYLPPVDGRQFGELEMPHSFQFRQELTHTALAVGQSGAAGVFLASLYPRLEGRQEPSFEAPAVMGGQAATLTVESSVQLGWTATALGDTVRIELPSGTFSSDSPFGVLSLEQGQVRSLTALGGHFAQLGERVIFTTSEGVDVHLAFGEGRVTGFVRGPQAGFQLLLPDVGRSVEVALAAPLVGSVAQQGTTVVLDLVGAGSLEIVLGEVLPGDFDGSGAVDLTDFFLFADAFGQGVDTPGAAPFDLDGSGAVDLADFFLFADGFGAGAE